MRCDACGKPATVHEIVIKNGEKSEVHYCLHHAIAAGLSIPAAQPIAALLAATGKTTKRKERTPSLLCPGCGLTLAEFKKSGRLGCPQCYDSLGKPLEATILAAQGGAPAHLGEAPVKASREEASRAIRAKLVQELEAAVSAEQYERAAALRDRLESLHREAGSSDCENEAAS